MARSGLAGPEIALIVNIYPVSNRLETALFSKLLHYLKKLVFAVEAALAVITDIFRALHLRSLNDLNRNIVLLGKSQCVLKLCACQAGRIGDYRQHVLP